MFEASQKVMEMIQTFKISMTSFQAKALKYVIVIKMRRQDKRSPNPVQIYVDRNHDSIRALSMEECV